MTMSISGSFRMSLKSSVNRSDTPCASACSGLREHTRTSSMSTPKRRLKSSRWLCRMSMQPPPTVPVPTSPSLMVIYPPSEKAVPNSSAPSQLNEPAYPKPAGQTKCRRSSRVSEGACGARNRPEARRHWPLGHAAAAEGRGRVPQATHSVERSVGRQRRNPERSRWYRSA